MIKAWSYSRHSTYAQCPYKAKLLYVAGLKEPANKAMERGAAVHHEIEVYLKNKVEELPESVVGCRTEIEQLRNVDALSESSWAFTQDWEPCDWFDKSTWVRARVDAEVYRGDHLLLVDFKTGKVRDSHKEQAELYALCGFSQYKDVNVVDVDYLYVDLDVSRKYTFGKADYELLAKKWHTLGVQMCTDNEFDKKPSRSCAWCNFNADKEGLCEYR